MGLTNDTNNLHFIAPTGSQIQMGTNVFFQNPEVSLNPGLILEATGPETGSSIYFNGGKGQIVGENDLSFLLITGDTNNNPSASISFAVSNIESGSINLFGKNNSSIVLDKDGNVGTSTTTGQASVFTNSGSISLTHGEYDGGLEIQPGYLQIRQNDLNGGLTMTSQSLAITANQSGSILSLNAAQGLLNLYAGADVNISSSLGTVNTFGTASFIGNMNLIGGPLSVSSSVGGPYAINVYNDGIHAEGTIQTDNGIQLGIDTGGQYNLGNVLFDSASFPADVYAGFQVYDPNTNFAAATLAANTYTSQYPGQVVGYIAGGGAYSGSDAAILLPASEAVVRVVKPTVFDAGATITGSLNHSGSVNITGALNVSNSLVLSGSQIIQGNGGNALQIVNAGILSQGTIISNNTIVDASDYPSINAQLNLAGSGSAFANFNAYTDVVTDAANVFSGYNIPTKQWFMQVVITHQVQILLLLSHQMVHSKFIKKQKLMAH
jgi:hypothetical protein